MGKIIPLQGVIKGNFRKEFAKQNQEESNPKKPKTKAEKAKETI